MTHDGVKRVMMVLTTVYPNFHPADMARTISVWEALFKGYDDGSVAKAVETYIRGDRQGFAPTPGQIIGAMDGTTELEAWGLVAKALRNGLYNAEEEFAKLPERVRDAVGSPGQLREWAMMDTDGTMVAQSNFIKSYKSANMKTHHVAISGTQTPQIEAREWTKAPDDFMKTVKEKLGWT